MVDVSEMKGRVVVHPKLGRCKVTYVGSHWAYLQREADGLAYECTLTLLAEMWSGEVKGATHV